MGAGGNSTAPAPAPAPAAGGNSTAPAPEPAPAPAPAPAANASRLYIDDHVKSDASYFPSSALLGVAALAGGVSLVAIVRRRRGGAEVALENDGELGLDDGEC